MYKPASIVSSMALLLSLMGVASCDREVATPIASKKDSDVSVTPSTQAPPRFDAAQFFESTNFRLSGAHAWSADGSKILIGSDETGIFNAYQLALTSGERVSVTSSDIDSVFPVSYFPNDERVLYRSDRGGNERHHLFVTGDVTSTNDNPIDLTPGEEVRAIFIGWADSGEHFYVTTNERDPQAMDVYEYSASDYKRKLVFTNTGNYTVADVSAPWVSLVRTNTNADSDVFLAKLNEPAAEPLLITAHVGDISHSVYTFSRDGQSLIYSTNEHGEFVQAWEYDLASGEKSSVVVADWDVLNVGYSSTGRYRYAYVNEDAAINVRIHDVEKNQALALDLPEGSVRGVRFSRDDQQVAVLITTDTSPANIFTADVQTGETKRWTVALNEEIDEQHLVDSVVVRYESFDGLEIPGILFRPKNSSIDSQVPALVWVHGGPGGQSIRGYSATIQHLVNHGYAVLAANNRGSSGYGKTFFHLDDRKHGEDDLDDIVHAKKYLATLDWVSKDQIGIIGGSYGGYMVGAALAFRPEAFDVGINIFGVMNWVRTLESIPSWWGPMRDSLYAELGDPAVDGERLRKISPLFHAGQIERPLLVVQGANDPRVLQVESDEIVAAVRANEVPVEYLLFEDEGHGFTKRENRIEASNAYISFLDKYL